MNRLDPVHIALVCGLLLLAPISSPNERGEGAGAESVGRAVVTRFNGDAFAPPPGADPKIESGDGPDNPVVVTTLGGGNASVTVLKNAGSGLPSGSLAWSYDGKSWLHDASGLAAVEFKPGAASRKKISLRRGASSVDGGSIVWHRKKVGSGGSERFLWKANAVDRVVMQGRHDITVDGLSYSGGKFVVTLSGTLAQHGSDFREFAFERALGSRSDRLESFLVLHWGDPANPTVKLVKLGKHAAELSPPKKSGVGHGTTLTSKAVKIAVPGSIGRGNNLVSVNVVCWSSLRQPGATPMIDRAGLIASFAAFEVRH